MTRNVLILSCCLLACSRPDDPGGPPVDGQTLRLEERAAITLPWHISVLDILPFGDQEAFVGTDSGVVWIDVTNSTAKLVLPGLRSAGLGSADGHLVVYDSAVSALREFDVSQVSEPREVSRVEVGHWQRGVQASCGWFFHGSSEAYSFTDQLEIRTGASQSSVMIDWGRGRHLTRLGVVLTAYEEGVVVSQRGPPYQVKAVACDGQTSSLLDVSRMAQVMQLLDDDERWVSLGLLGNDAVGWIQTFSELRSHQRLLAWWPRGVGPQTKRVSAPLGLVQWADSLIWAVRDVGLPEIVLFETQGSR